MKNNSITGAAYNNMSTRKFFLIMKSTLILLFINIVQASAISYSQDTKVSMNVNDVPLEVVIDNIESQTGFKFLYRVEMIDVSQKVSVHANNRDVVEVLAKVFPESKISYEILENKLIVLTPSSPDKTVTGIVKDAEGLPIPGVTVRVEGSSEGTITDFEGTYTIIITEKSKNLVFSFVGMKTLVVPIEGRELIDVVLETDVIGIDEVVAIGYGTVKKRDLTGAVFGVNSDDISDQPKHRLDEALQGRIPGVSINKISGAPGGDIKIRIRGSNSISGGNTPLIVIDGLIGGDINNINPDDIQSVDFLKDASSTAIYGSRGANGVIIVSTKNAKLGEPKVEFHAYTGIGQVYKRMDLLDAGDWATLCNRQDEALGRPVLTFTDQEIQDYYTNGGTDWQDEVLQQAISQNYQLSLSGGTEKLNYFISGNFADEEGIILNTGYKRYGVRTNLKAIPVKNVNFNLNLYGVHEDRHNTGNGGINSPLGSAMPYSSVFPVWDDELDDYSSDVDFISTTAKNPVFQAYEKNTDIFKNSLTGSTSLEFLIGKHLSFSVNAGFRLIDTDRFNFSRYVPGADVQSSGAYTRSSLFIDWQNYYNLSYSRKFGSHDIKATAIYERSSWTSKNMGTSASGFPSVTLGYKDISLASTQLVSSSFGGAALQSYLGRINYSFKDRYILTASFRADGSSKFAEGNKYSYFPSVGVAWRLMEEPFIKNLGIFQNFKIRASWGETGNQAIGSFQTLSTLVGDFPSPLDGTTLYPGIGPNRIANPDLKWETTIQRNIGADLGFFNGRLRGSFELYHKSTKDLLVQIFIPNYTGVRSKLSNIGEVENKGFEVSINAVPVNNDNFTWELGFNFSQNRNKVIEIGDTDKPDEQLLNSNGLAGSRVIKEGLPLGTFYGMDYVGIWQIGEEAEAAVYGNVPGDARYNDLDTNGIKDDLTYIGDPNPDFSWGFTQTFQYKNFSLSMLIEGVHGFDKFNGIRFYTIGGGPNIFSPTARETFANQWSADNPNGTVPAFNASNVTNYNSTYFVEDASFIRMRNITLAYTFGKPILPKFFSSLNVYASCSNLFTITNYKGFDPEAQTSAGNDANSGADNGAYPNPTIVTFGIKIAL